MTEWLLIACVLAACVCVPAFAAGWPGAAQY